MCRAAAIATVVLLLTNCAARTGVVPIGQDTYMVARQGWVSTQSVTELKAQAFTEANSFCSSQGKSLQPVTTKETPGVFGRSYPESELQFRCLGGGDEELSRPVPQKMPDVVIENRYR